MAQHMTILGAGPALPDAERDNTFMIWQSPTGHLLIDCGGRAYQQLLRAKINPADIRAVLLTHAHPDHIYGLPAFVFHLWLAHYPGTLDIYANAPTLAMCQAMCDAMRLPQNGHMCKVAWHTIPETVDVPVFSTPGYSVWTTPGAHTVPTLAVKITDHETRRTLVYSSDTAPTPSIAAFAHGADTLIHEATTADPHEGYGHTTPYQAGEIGRTAEVERLVLIHYSQQSTMPEVQALADVQAAGFTGNVLIATELGSHQA